MKKSRGSIRAVLQYRRAIQSIWDMIAGITSASVQALQNHPSCLLHTRGRGTASEYQASRECLATILSTQAMSWHLIPTFQTLLRKAIPNRHSIRSSNGIKEPCRATIYHIRPYNSDLPPRALLVKRAASVWRMMRG